MAEQPSGVVRMGMIRRLPELSPEAFSAHWRGPHGRLATRIPNVRRYHQNHTIARLPFGDRADRWVLDGFSQLWFDDIDSMTQGITAPSYTDLAKDTATVMTMPGLLVGPQEIAVAGDWDSPHKAMVCVGRRPDLTSAAFIAEWRRRTAQLAGVAGLNAVVNIFIVHRESTPAKTVPYELLRVDVVTEFWFVSAEAMRKAFAGPVPDLLQELAADASACAVKTYVVVV